MTSSRYCRIPGGARSESGRSVRQRGTAAATPDPDEDPEVTQAFGSRRLAAERAEARPEDCGEVDPGPMELGICIQPKGHKFMHKSALGTWPM